MAGFEPNKLHVKYEEAILNQEKPFPRCYTLTHSDLTGDLFLSIGKTTDQTVLNNWYTRLMRDEVFADWENDEQPQLNIHCHVSGGIVLGPAKWRLSIFKQHLPLVLKAICYGDQDFIRNNPSIQSAPIMVHFHARQTKFNSIESYGFVKDYLT
jgi:hypothetical protein